MKKLLCLSLSVMMLLSMANTSYSRGKRTNAYQRSRVSATNVFTNEIKKKKMDCDDALLYCYDQSSCETRGGMWQTSWTKSNPNDADNLTETITEWINPSGKTIYGMCFDKVVDGVEQEDTEHVCSEETPIYCGTEDECVNVGLVWSDIIPASKCQTRQSLCEANGAGTWINGECSCPENFVFSEVDYVCREKAEVFYCTDQKSEALLAINNTISSLREMSFYSEELPGLKKEYKSMDKKASKMKTTAIITGTTAVAATTWAGISIGKNINIKKCLCDAGYRAKHTSKKGKCERLIGQTGAKWDSNGQYTIYPKYKSTKENEEITLEEAALREYCKGKYSEKSSAPVVKKDEGEK